MGLTCRNRELGEVTVLDLCGRICLADAFGLGSGRASRLHDLVRTQVAEGHHRILLNLHEVTYIDSHGIGELVACFTTLRSHGGQLRVCATGLVASSLRIAHLDALLNMAQDEATALQSFTPLGTE